MSDSADEKRLSFVVPLPASPVNTKHLPFSLREKLLQQALHLVAVKKAPSGTATLLMCGVPVLTDKPDVVLDLLLKVRQTLGEGLLQAASVATGVKVFRK